MFSEKFGSIVKQHRNVVLNRLNGLNEFNYPNRLKTYVQELKTQS